MKEAEKQLQKELENEYKKKGLWNSYVKDHKDFKQGKAFGVFSGFNKDKVQQLIDFKPLPLSSSQPKI